MDRPTVASRPRTLVVALEPPELTATVLDPAGAIVAGPARTVLPAAAQPEVVLPLLWSLVETLDEFDRTTFIRPEMTSSLGDGWDAFELERALAEQSLRPARVVRGAQLVSRPAIAGVGVELVLSLGAQFSSALFVDGREAPGFDLGRHRFRKKRTYADYVAGEALSKQGRKKWNKRVHGVIAEVLAVFSPHRLYLTGRDAATVYGELPANVEIVPDQMLAAALAVWA